MEIMMDNTTESLPSPRQTPKVARRPEWIKSLRRDAIKRIKIQAMFGKMDDIYGDQWRDSLDIMLELSGKLPLGIQGSPKLKDIKALYEQAKLQ